MFKCLAFLVSISLSVICFSQGFIGDSKKRVKKGLNKYISKTKVSASIEETDSTIALPLRDPKFKHADFLFHFNKANKCDRETRVSCDSCINNYLNEALSNKSYGWIKVNPTTFLSRYSRHLIMKVTNDSNTTTVTINKINLSKELYTSFSKNNK